MSKRLIYFFIFCLLISSAFAISMTSELPAQATPGGTFDMNLIVSGSSGNYGVLYIIDITGGCTSDAGETHIASGFLGTSDKTSTVSMKAPSSGGPCIFTGDYQFADATGTYDIVYFPSKTVTISGGCVPHTCSSLEYVCGSHSDGCGGTIDCGTCESGETCTNGGCMAEGCSCGGWQESGCVGAAMKYTRVCNPLGCDDETKYSPHSSCEEISNGEKPDYMKYIWWGLGIFAVFYVLRGIQD